MSCVPFRPRGPNLQRCTGGYINQMEDRLSRVSSLLHEASKVHHVVYRKTDGDDPDWASWYSDWLVNLTELPEILGRQPVRSELTFLLVGLDRQYGEQQPDERWEDWYARHILAHLSAG